MYANRVLIPLQKFRGSFAVPEDRQILHLFKKIGNNLCLQDSRLPHLISIAKDYTMPLSYLQYLFPLCQPSSINIVKY